ncbi:DUF7553 family protein [Natronomonas sp. EA1]|uniref:DUF7553 family protein n=1 Tax=Natronomonas sp. EA1 TaxID=3421655 RepID=UPI003EBCD3D1
MNKHFEDTRYYLKRAGQTAKAGMAEEVHGLEAKFGELTRRDDEPEEGRMDQFRAELEELYGKAEGEAKEALGKARAKLDEYRARDRKPAA